MLMLGLGLWRTRIVVDDVSADNGLAPTMTSANSFGFGEFDNQRFQVVFSKETLRDILFGPDAGYWEVEASAPYATSFYVRWAGGEKANYEDPLGHTVDGNNRPNSYGLIIRPTDRFARTGIDYTVTVNISNVNETLTLTFPQINNNAVSTMVAGAVQTVTLPTGVTINFAITGAASDEGVQKNGSGATNLKSLTLVNGDTLKPHKRTGGGFSATTEWAWSGGEPTSSGVYRVKTTADPSWVPAVYARGATGSIGKAPFADGYATTSWTTAALPIGTAIATRQLLIAVDLGYGSVTGILVNGSISATLLDYVSTASGNRRLSVYIAAVPTGTACDVVITGNGAVFGYQYVTLIDVDPAPTYIGKDNGEVNYQNPHTAPTVTPSGGFSVGFALFEVAATPTAISGTTLLQTASSAGYTHASYSTVVAGASDPGLNIGDPDRSLIVFGFGA